MKGNRSALKYQRINLTEVMLLNIVTLGSSALLLLQSGALLSAVILHEEHSEHSFFFSGL